MGRLGHAGATIALKRALFPEGFAGEVMQLVLATWYNFALHRRVRLETRITAVFRDALIEAYVAAGRSWFVTLEEPGTDPTFGTVEGRNDLNFYPPAHHGQTVFFTVECKRLRLQGARRLHRLANKYVEDGMLRFVQGQYSQGLPCGGMVGYVMDNQIDKALDNICAEISRRARKLRMRRERLCMPSRCLPSHQFSADTYHARADGNFALHHVLLGVD